MDRVDRVGWVGWAVGVLMGWLALGAPALAVVGGTPAPASDPRFDAVGLVITDQPWAPCGGWISGTCVLIGHDRVALTRHQVQNALRQLPIPGARTHKIRFRRGADGRVNNQVGQGQAVDCAGGFQEIYVDRFISSPSTGLEVIIGVLERAPVGIAPMPVYPSHTVVSGEPITMAGWGYDGVCLGTGQAWTLRTRSGVIPPLRYNGWCCFDYNNTSFTTGNCIVIPAGANWVIGNLHDSGAPLLSPDPLNPTRLRVVALVTTVTTAEKLSAWNGAGGTPRFVDTQLSTACVPDYNGDGQLTVEDLLAYLQMYFAGHPAADVDGLPGISVNDLFVYLTAFLQGCP